MKIAVLGATGTVGRHLIEALSGMGVETVGVSRGSGTDVTTGAGLAESFAGVQRVVDVTNAPRPEQKAASEFFTAAGPHVQEAAHRAGVERIIVLSTVGIDRFTQGYYVAKQQQERIARAGPVPAWILRSTKFHEFAGQVLTWWREADVGYVPDLRVQPIAAASTAGALAELVLTNALAQPFAEVAGPRVERLLDMATRSRRSAATRRM